MPFRVFVRYQLYVEGPATGVSIAGGRLLKGDTRKHARPSIEFVSDTPDEAEKNRKALEDYLNAWESESKKPND